MHKNRNSRNGNSATINGKPRKASSIPSSPSAGPEAEPRSTPERVPGLWQAISLQYGDTTGWIITEPGTDAAPTNEPPVAFVNNEDNGISLARRIAKDHDEAGRGYGGCIDLRGYCRPDSGRPVPPWVYGYLLRAVGTDGEAFGAEYSYLPHCRHLLLDFLNREAAHRDEAAAQSAPPEETPGVYSPLPQRFAGQTNIDNLPPPLGPDAGRFPVELVDKLKRLARELWTPEERREMPFLSVGIYDFIDDESRGGVGTNVDVVIGDVDPQGDPVRDPEPVKDKPPAPLLDHYFPEVAEWLGAYSPVDDEQAGQFNILHAKEEGRTKHMHPGWPIATVLVNPAFSPDSAKRIARLMGKAPELWRALLKATRIIGATEEGCEQAGEMIAALWSAAGRPPFEQFVPDVEGYREEMKEELTACVPGVVKAG